MTTNWLGMRKLSAPRRVRRGRRHLIAGMMAALAASSLVCAALAAPASAAPASAAPAAAPNAQPLSAYQQLEWLIDASARAPVSTAELEQHITTQFLAAAGGPAAINQAFGEVGLLTLQQVLLRQAADVEAVATSSNGSFLIDVQTDASGLIDALGIGPYVAAPTTWPQLDSQLLALAPEVSFAAATISPEGTCHIVDGINADTPRPLGSAFKLYVLGALGQAVADHRASWNEQLAIHEQWKSLPSGVLQNDPAGTELTLRQYADYMISISDNTAADHLIHFLGRDAVQAQLLRFGNRNAELDIPFLTTRELFALKSVDYPTLADGYLALTPAQRTAELATLDQIPLTQLAGWTQPEMINQIEWFASPADICRAYAGLWQQNRHPGLAPIGQALSINDGGIALNRADYPLVWFKGGSEPGVLTLNYLARAADGQILVSSLMLANPGSPFNEAAITGEILALARGGIQLASQHG